MPSNKSLLIRSQKVYEAINLMLQSWAAKTTATMGSKQLVNELLTAAENTYTVEKWDGEIPSWNGGDIESVPVERERLFKGVMTLEAAYQSVDDAADDAMKRFERISGPQNIKLRIKRGLSWRKWVSIPAAKRIMAFERLTCRGALALATLKKRRRVGRQRISTRSKRALPVGRFLFGGRAALRMPRGRPPLPEQEWRRRYLARKIRRQKHNATSIRRNRKAVTVPATKTERPTVVQKLGPAPLKVGKKS